MTVHKSHLTLPCYVHEGAYIGPDVRTGKYLGVSEGARIQRATLGAYCCIGHRVSINPYQHPIHWLSSHGFQYHRYGFDAAEYRNLTKLPYESVVQRDVTIGNDVWVGDNAVVMADVGDGAIIGAGAVVTRYVPPYAVTAGSPAQVIYFRFHHGIIERLLRVKWWDMELSELEGLPFNNIAGCLDMLEKKKKKVAA